MSSSLYSSVQSARSNNRRLIRKKIYCSRMLQPPIETILSDMKSRALNVDICKFLNADSTRTNVEEECSLTLLKMLEEGLHADITIKANGGSVKAHSCVLASISPVFNAMFKHQMREQLSSTVELLEMSIEGLQFFLVLIYILPDHTAAMEEFGNSVNEHFNELFEACCKYQVIRLEPTLTENVYEYLSTENCWDYLRKCEAISGFCGILDYKTSSTGPYAVCREYVFANFDNVLESESLILEMQTDPMNVIFYLRGLTRKQENTVSRNYRARV